VNQEKEKNIAHVIYHQLRRIAKANDEDFNSRMKDFYDIWLLSKLFSFEGSILQKALKNTFERRGTVYPTLPPVAFMPDFYGNPQKLIQWEAFVKKSKLKISVGSLASVIAEISDFLTPVMQSHGTFENVWQSESGRWIKLPAA
jgi:hypothetical protein